MKQFISPNKGILLWVSAILLSIFPVQKTFSQTGKIEGSGTVTYNSDGSVTVGGSKSSRATSFLRMETSTSWSSWTL